MIISSRREKTQQKPPHTKLQRTYSMVEHSKERLRDNPSLRGIVGFFMGSQARFLAKTIVTLFRTASKLTKGVFLRLCVYLEPPRFWIGNIKSLNHVRLEMISKKKMGSLSHQKSCVLQLSSPPPSANPN